QSSATKTSSDHLDCRLMSRRQKLSGGARLYSNRRTCSLLLTFMPKKPRWKSRIAAQQSVSLSQIGIAAGILRREAFFIGNCFFDCLLGGGIGHGRHQGNRRHARDRPRARDPGGSTSDIFRFYSRLRTAVDRDWRWFGCAPDNGHYG